MELHEARIHIHSGIRLYYMWHGKEIILLLAGGNKATQSKDIEKAKEMIERIKEGISWTIN